MKQIYTAPTKEAAKAALKDFKTKWESKYSYAIRSWENNWDELTVFFDFPIEIRTIIYTTNLIENLNGKIIKYTKKNLRSKILMFLGNSTKSILPYMWIYKLLAFIIMPNKNNN